MTIFRPFRNDDAPALTDLWNSSLPQHNVVAPLTPHEFDTLVISKQGFHREGLIVAQRDDLIIGFAHAGFGPIEPLGPSHALDYQMGTIAMIVQDPDFQDSALGLDLVRACEEYLRGRGAQVIYAGGQMPLNPFYWGVYGGSEFAGILKDHASFHQAVTLAGYQVVSKVLILEARLDKPESRDPRSTLLKRQVRLEKVIEDALPEGWWDAQAIGVFRPSQFRVTDRVTDRPIGSARTWDIAGGCGLGDGLSRVGLIDVFIEPHYRRRGMGRLLVAEILRYAREHLVDIVAVQTPETNTPALGLYLGLGFETVDQALLYRHP